MNSYQQTLRYSNLPNARPLFQSYIQNETTEKRYYSSTDVGIYFGDLFIEEASQLTYEISESAMVLYGYNSYVFDDVVKGARMIQGQLAIHFIRSGYLFDVLNILSQKDQKDAVKLSEHRPLWATSFDLYIKHGGANLIQDDLQFACLERITLTGCRTQYDATSGEPIKEIYSFVGKDIDYGFNFNQEDTAKPGTSISNITLLHSFYDKEKKELAFRFDVPFILSKAYITLHNGLSVILEGTSETKDYFTCSITPTVEKILEEELTATMQLNYHSKENGVVLTKDFAFYFVIQS